MKAFLFIAFLFTGTVKSSMKAAGEDIAFGSFGDDDIKVSHVTTGSAELVESVESAPVEPQRPAPAPAFVQAVFAPIRGDHLNRLKKAEQVQQNRFRQVNSIPGRLNLRLGRDHFMGSIMDYSLEALFECFKYLELPSNLKECSDTKISTLNSLFELSYTTHQGLAGLQNSFLHPTCFDAMKYLGDSLQSYQIDWLIENAPGALFDNFELLTSLKNYSFLTSQVYEKYLEKFKTLGVVDFLAIPAFIKTGPVDLIMTFLTTVFEPSRHWNILLENRGLADLIKDQGIAENPLYYPFFVGIGSIEYLLDASDITKKIRRNGLTRLALASLIAYVQESNNSIQHLMTEIAEAWADLHKNSHLTDTPNVNEEFNERIQLPLKHLIFAKSQREDLNKLIKEFEEAKIPADPSSIVKLCPNWLKSLKILVQTPFNGMMRLSFASRFSPYLMATIHPDDQGNLVKLPRIITPENREMRGIYMQADPAHIFNPLIWSSLWRNIFYNNGEDWRQDPEIIQNQNRPDWQIEEYLKSKYETIYRDSKFGVIDLIDAWTNLSQALPEIYSRGPRLLRFIASISVPVPPPSQGFKLTLKQSIERKVFAEKVLAVMVDDIRLIDKQSVEIIKFNLNDSEEVVKVMDELSLKVSNSGNFISIKRLEIICKRLNFILNNQTLPVTPMKRFEILRIFETSFALLGSTLNQDQIKELGESDEINKFLTRHGRAFTRSQVDGLLKSDWGRSFLRSNKPMLTGLIDYSYFKPGDFEDLEVAIDEIRLNLATAPASSKLLNLVKRGFSNVDDPLFLVYSLGSNLWTDINNFKSLSLWELLNPIVLAYDLTMTDDCAFIYHMTGLKPKLHGRVVLEMALVFITKWLIAQDWYALVYHMAISKGTESLGPVITSRLVKIYPKYLTEGEFFGRRDLSEWLQVAEQGRTIEGKDDSKDDLIYALAGLSVAVDTAPLTPYREMINQSTSSVADLLAMPFSSPSHSPSLLLFVKSLIMKYFKSDDKSVWLNRLEILSQFSPETGGLRNDPGCSSLIRTRLSTLPTFDALIYKWALEFEGVCVESIFRNVQKEDLEIDPKARVAVLKKLEQMELKTVTVTVKESNNNDNNNSNSNSKKNNKKKNKNKK
jgi:hypothetical protein